MSDNDSYCSSETDICEFLSGFPPEELTDELLGYAAKKYCKPDDKPRKPVTTKYDDPARRFDLERRLRSLKMKEDEAFDHFYYEKFEDLRDELTDTGRELDNESLVYLILNALPPSWSKFVDRVVAKGLDVIPYGNLLLDIESEEENRERLRVQRMLEKLQEVQGGARIEPTVQKSQPQVKSRPQVVQGGMMGARLEPVQRPQPQVVQGGMMGARFEPFQRPQPQVKPQPQVVQGGMMGARFEPVQKPPPQVKPQPRVVQGGMMGARFEPVQRPQPQVVQGGMMGTRVGPIGEMKGKGVESSRSQQQQQRQQRQRQRLTVRQSESRGCEQPEVWVLGSSLIFPEESTY